MYLGDNLIADGISSLVDEYRRIGCNSQILLARVPNPGAVRRRRARRRPRLPPDGEAEGARIRPRPRRRLHVRRLHLRGGQGDPAERPARARDHRRDPVAHRPWQDRPSASRDGLVEGHRKDRGHARGEPDHARHVRGERTRGDRLRLPGRRESRRRKRSAPLAEHRARPGDHRRGSGDPRRVRGTLHGDRPRLRRRPLRDRELDRPSGLEARADSGDESRIR